MDYLQEAKEWMEACNLAWEDGDEDIAATNTQFAIAHALIAIAEQLHNIADDTRTIKSLLPEQ